MSEVRKEELEGLLAATSEKFLTNGFNNSDELKALSEQKASGAFLLLFEDEASVQRTLSAFDAPLPESVQKAIYRRENGPAKFQFMPAEGIAFLFRQLDLPNPPAITFNVSTQCVVVSAVCLQNEDGEGRVYQNVFVYTY